MAILGKHIKEELFKNYEGPGGPRPPREQTPTRPAPPPSPVKPSPHHEPVTKGTLSPAEARKAKAELDAMKQDGPKVYDSKTPPNVSFSKPGTYIIKAGSDGTLTLRVPKPDMSEGDRKPGIRVEWSTIQIGDLKPGQQYKVSFKPIDGGKRAEISYVPVGGGADRPSAPRTASVSAKPVRLPPVDNPYPPAK